jgi:hypothetical protein
MEDQQLNIKLLETAIGAMQRNRTLLFAINLIAALVLVLVYLEWFSIDQGQMQGYLIAYQGRCTELRNTMQKTLQWECLTSDEKDNFNDCSDLDKISRIIITNINERVQLTGMSMSLFKLHQNRNDLTSTKLGTANVTPLGLGLEVPRNDMYVILGVLLVTLYIWLAFSFSQHARITTKIKKLFPEPDPENRETQATISDLVELNFLFRTSQGGKTLWVVKVLYWLAPISMTIASINNSILKTSEGFRAYLAALAQIPLIVQWALTIALWVIGYYVNKSDKVANVEPVVELLNQANP